MIFKSSKRHSLANNKNRKDFVRNKSNSFGVKSRVTIRFRMSAIGKEDMEMAEPAMASPFYSALSKI